MDIIKNIIGPYFSDSLVKDVSDGYILQLTDLIDEFTDITIKKKLRIATRCYSKDNINIVSAFLDLIHI